MLEDPRLGAAARSLFADAGVLLERVVKERLLHASAVVGFWPADSTADDDIVLFTDDSRICRARPPAHPAPADGQAGWSAESRLSDFVAPVGSGVEDFVGAFAVTAGGGLDEAKGRFEEDGDDYARSC